ncbi:hypothetical protein L2E82_06841 [Cichorium intybus]|uniref:Uncharacterized protein n=1 Tax=Cichorium intybus TaxID=13427 RepID=A0ACB9HBL0_CICIN|nr:hypothetical protein L2E82_06841 [Cichorium intybus]
MADVVNVQHDQVIVFSAQSLEDYEISKKQSDFPYSFKVAENLEEKKNQYRSCDYKGSMFKNYSGSLIEATDERSSKEKSKTLHQKRLPIVINDGLMTEIVPSDGPMLEDSNVKSTVVAMEAATTRLGLADGGDKDFDRVCQPIKRPDVVEGMVEDDIVIAGNLSDEVVDGDRCENNSNEVAGSMGNEAVSDALVSTAVTSVLERAPSTVMHADQVLEEDQMQTVTSAGKGKSGTTFLPSANMSSPLRKITDESSFLSINDKYPGLGNNAPSNIKDLSNIEGRNRKCRLNQVKRVYVLKKIRTLTFPWLIT